MGKTVSTQLALFGGLAIQGEARGVFAFETFRKAGKSYKGKRDKEGFALTDAGDKIKTADVVSFLPAKSKDKEDMADATGLTGQALKFHNISVRQSALQTAYGLVSGEIAKGGYMLANGGLKRGVDGTITLKIKPSAIRVVQAAPMTDDELIAEAVKRGLVKDPQ